MMATTCRELGETRPLVMDLEITGSSISFTAMCRNATYEFAIQDIESEIPILYLTRLKAPSSGDHYEFDLLDLTHWNTHEDLLSNLSYTASVFATFPGTAKPDPRFWNSKQQIEISFKMSRFLVEAIRAKHSFPPHGAPDRPSPHRINRLTKAEPPDMDGGIIDFTAIIV